MAIPAKKRKCRVCRESFQPKRCLQQACSYECEVKLAELAAAKSKAKREKDCRVAEMASRKIFRMAKDKHKTITEHAADTQKPVNAYIRYRDKDKGCISCGKPLRGTFHAGHYKPVGKGLNWFIRFHHDNIFGQCIQCNNYKSGNQAEMRKGVLARIGQERLDWIEGPHPDAKFTVEQLKQIASEHKQLLKELRK